CPGRRRWPFRPTTSRCRGAAPSSRSPTGTRCCFSSDILRTTALAPARTTMRRFVVAASVLLAAAGCRIEDRTPTGSRQDEATVREVLAAFYQSRAAHDWAGARDLMWDSATVELHQPVAGGLWSIYRSADDYLTAERRASRGAEPGDGVRVVR